MGKGLEDDLPLVCWNADSGIRHGEVQANKVVRLLLGLDTNDDLSAFGELDRVAHEVDDDLPQTSGVAYQRIGHGRQNATRQLETLLFSPKCQRIERLAEAFAQAEANRLQLEPSRFDLRKIEDVIEQPKERIGRVVDDSKNPAARR